MPANHSITSVLSFTASLNAFGNKLAAKVGRPTSSNNVHKKLIGDELEHGAISIIPSTVKNCRKKHQVLLLCSAAFAIFLSAESAHAFAPTCALMNSAEYDKAVMQEAFDLVGNLNEDTLKGVVHEILWRDKFNCHPDNIRDGKFAKLSTKRTDGMADIYVYDKENRVQPERKQLKDHGGRAGALQTCSVVADDPSKYLYATLLLTEEGYQGYLEALQSPHDNACKRMNKKVQPSGIKTEETSKIASLKNNVYMTRVNADGDLVDNRGNKFGKHPVSDANLPDETRQAVQEMERRHATYEARGVHQQTLHDDGKQKYQEKAKAANDNPPPARGEDRAGLAERRTATAQAAEGAGTSTEKKVVAAQAVEEVAVIRIAKKYVPEGTTDFVIRAKAILGKIPYVKQVVVVASAGVSGYYLVKVVLDKDDPAARNEDRIKEAVKSLVDEGAIAIGTLAGTAAGGATGGLIGLKIAAACPALGPLAPACAPIVVVIGTTIGGAAGGIAGSYAAPHLVEYVFEENRELFEALNREIDVAIFSALHEDAKGGTAEQP